MTKRTKIDWDAQPLGQVSDGVIASALGCTRVAVGQQRRKRGIPRSKAASGRPCLTDWDEQPLGELSDKAIARVVGCTVWTVWSQRRKRGIAPARLAWSAA